jgi:hypothetical protein
LIKNEPAGLQEQKLKDNHLGFKKYHLYIKLRVQLKYRKEPLQKIPK